MNKRRIGMGAVRKLKKIQIYQSEMKKVERKSLLGNIWRKPVGCQCCRERKYAKQRNSAIARVEQGNEFKKPETGIEAKKPIFVRVINY